MPDEDARSSPRIVPTLIAAAALAGVLLLARQGILRHPLGLDDASESRAGVVNAARGIETRGFLACGGLGTTDPLPVPAEEAIDARHPPLLAWTAVGLRAAFGLDHARAAVVAESLFVVVGALAVLSLARRRSGPVTALVAAFLFALAPLVATRGAGGAIAAYAAALAFAALLDIHVATRSPTSAAAMVAVSCAGALSGWSFVVDGAFLAVAGVILLRRAVLHPMTALAVASPFAAFAAVVAAMERTAGTAEVLGTRGLGDVAWGGWCALLERLASDLTPPALVVGIVALLADARRRPREGAIPLALLGSAIAIAAASHRIPFARAAADLRFAAPVALGCALAAGWIARRSFAAAALATCALVLVDLGGAPWNGAADAEAVDALSRAVRARVALGEAFATSFPRPAVLVAACERPVVAGVREVMEAERVVALADAARHPIRWLFADADDPEIEPVRAVGFERFAVERDGRILAFDLTRPTSPRPPRTVGTMRVVHVPQQGYRVETPAAPDAASWRIDVGGRSLGFDFAVSVDPSTKDVALPDRESLPERLYVRAVPIGKDGRPGTPCRELFVPTRGFANLRSRTMLLVPLGGALLAAFALAFGLAFPARKPG
ncbi:MAG TPA: hypothetical protein VKE69_12565, partial [Planctomycetota bacterium]|nr:hypothetical protein [Planctomycetota bacterium]